MATQQMVSSLTQTVNALKSVDKERLLRRSLGEESLLQASFEAKFDDILKQSAFALEYAPAVDENAVGNVRSVLEQIKNELDTQAKRTNPDYVNNRSQFVPRIEALLQQMRQFWPPFVTAAIEARGFLQDEGIRKEYEKTVADMQAQAAQALAQVKEESSKTIEEAKKLAQEIEERARRTAARISVKEAQEQFKLAQNDHQRQVGLWSVLTAFAIAAFFIVAIYLARVQFPEDWRWHVVYFTAIRITILTAVGAVATFCLRVLRAHLHMSQHNLHRQRVANSMAAFVESAVTPEQRDLILAQLVTAIVEFGTSGLLPKEEDAVYSPKMTVDSITRMIASPVQKG